MTLFYGIALICFCAAAAFLLRAYRRLLALDARCEVAAAVVEAELSRRHAMLPALVGVMRVFAPHEREAADAVARAHAAAQRAATPQARLLAETRLADSVRQLLAKAGFESRLQKLDDFRELQAALDDAERRLAAARRNLSAATDDYNLALERFPASLFAVRLRLTPRVFYDIGVERALG